MCTVKNCNGWKFSSSDYLCAIHQKEEEKLQQERELKLALSMTKEEFLKELGNPHLGEYYDCLVNGVDA